MIARVYRLMDTKRLELKLRELQFAEDSVLIKPEHLAICAADLRYYFGRRKREVLRKKLPMALVHEATGTVLRDYAGKAKEGSKVVLIPLEEGACQPEVKGNYRKDSQFASSGVDGFLRDLIVLPANRVLHIEGEYSPIYVFCEIVSVALGAVQVFEASKQTNADSFGVWGDGSMGFVMSLILRCKYPKASIYVFGKEPRKLIKFSFATQTFYVDQVPRELTVSHGFECVGGAGSEVAIRQILDIISPQGVINLLGVSEQGISLNTRKLMDKGLQLVGHSRSDTKDLAHALEMIHEDEFLRKYLKILVSEMVTARTEDDLYKAFEHDVMNDFKTVIRWAI